LFKEEDSSQISAKVPPGDFPSAAAPPGGLTSERLFFELGRWLSQTGTQRSMGGIPSYGVSQADFELGPAENSEGASASPVDAMENDPFAEGAPQEQDSMAEEEDDDPFDF
ncbi:MAG: hypothetical protein MI725_16970, partial [Pirellulales bacterium]|nr:hypothetical protein [Pirellulales bacterium]